MTPLKINKIYIYLSVKTQQYRKISNEFKVYERRRFFRRRKSIFVVPSRGGGINISKK